ncbi:hypothetical protein BD410DRAFT_789875 [Rickenella mellea]|uniref:Secreted protein n=1 Tax=Rickenella mellea TaxID=50990 RepID=A0A4Y7Q288_9AGAM|nr:hypothetical protein BD410DRAFT_789875 [Rickenella mellea]
MPSVLVCSLLYPVVPPLCAYVAVAYHWSLCDGGLIGEVVFSHEPHFGCPSN